MANTMYLDEFVRIGNLVWFDGPELALMQYSDTNQLFIFDWVDFGHDYNRWLIFEVNVENVSKFINREISHLELFDSSIGRITRTYFVDIPASNDQWHLEIEWLPVVPSKYYPTTALFDPKYCPDIEGILTYLNSDESFIKSTDTL